MSTEPVRAGADWLALREPADANARAGDLVDVVRGTLTGTGAVVVHDLGSGSGAMARWLAPQLPGPQHWVMYDRDAQLLPLVRAAPPGPASDATPVTFETRELDVTLLDPGELAHAALVTASALLDMMTAPELHRFAAGCARPGCAVLVALSVTGRVELDPPDPLDEPVRAAFNAHQRRDPGGGPLLGPDAVDAAVAAFTGLGREVVDRPSPWRLGPGHRELAQEWFAGWVAAAVEQQPDLAEAARAYSRRRLAELARAELVVTVHHRDLLVLPPA
jgi:hypothetical protein